MDVLTLSVASIAGVSFTGSLPCTFHKPEPSKVLPAGLFSGLLALLKYVLLYALPDTYRKHLAGQLDKIHSTYYGQLRCQVMLHGETVTVIVGYVPVCPFPE